MVLKVEVSPDLIAGDVDEGYGKVADVFRRNLTSGQEVGAAVAVYRDGVKVVDLWGGFRNGITKAPWAEDTLVPTFSTTKGLSALAVAVAASQGLISYDAKVADYWPEFAQAAKDTITVRQLLSHQAGLPVLDVPLTLPDLADPTKMSAALAAQAPAWIPGTRHGYHAITLGWYESMRHAQRFLSAFSGISAHFRPRRHRLSATQWRTEIAERFAVWREVTTLDAAA